VSRCARFLAAVAVCGACALAQAGAVRIELQPRAQQHGAALMLGDVAVVTGAAAEQKTVSELALPTRGRVGDTVVYGRAEIARLLAQRHPQLHELQWAGAARVLVQRSGQTLPAAALVEQARTQLLAALAPRDGRFVLQPLTEPRALALPAGRPQLTARAPQQIGPRMKVWLDVAVDGRHYVSVPVTFAVTWLRPALILTRAQPAKAVLGADAVALGEVDAAPAGGAVVQESRQLVGKRLRRGLNEGAVLRETDLEERPAIAAGAGVDVFTAVGRVVVQTKAIAERDGFVGQSIAARTLQTNESLMIEVIGEDRAIVSNSPQR
jgi:flagellar basal body P-ring formation protein FlgA